MEFSVFCTSYINEASTRHSPRSSGLNAGKGSAFLAARTSLVLACSLGHPDLSLSS